jgi:hypothetical protein
VFAAAAAAAAADQIKCPHPMGWTLANMALSAMEYKDTYIMFGEWENAKRGLGWGIDWLVKAHLTASDTATANVFVAQVGSEQLTEEFQLVNCSW